METKMFHSNVTSRTESQEKQIEKGGWIKVQSRLLKDHIQTQVLKPLFDYENKNNYTNRLETDVNDVNINIFTNDQLLENIASIFLSSSIRSKDDQSPSIIVDSLPSSKNKFLLQFIKLDFPPSFENTSKSNNNHDNLNVDTNEDSSENVNSIRNKNESSNIGMKRNHSSTITSPVVHEDYAIRKQLLHATQNTKRQRKKSNTNAGTYIDIISNNQSYCTTFPGTNRFIRDYLIFQRDAKNGKRKYRDGHKFYLLELIIGYLLIDYGIEKYEKTLHFMNKQLAKPIGKCQLELFSLFKNNTFMTTTFSNVCKKILKLGDEYENNQVDNEIMK